LQTRDILAAIVLDIQTKEIFWKGKTGDCISGIYGHRNHRFCIGVKHLPVL
jgi:hypothetical protein